jgi:gliding motility associated protien GldN
MKKGIFLILSFVSFTFVFAQFDDTQIPPPLSAPWEIVEVNEFPGPIPYPKVKASDIMWHVYIWRQIDLREKRNHGLYFPTLPQGEYKSLGQIIMDAIDMTHPENEDALPVYTNENCNIKVDRANIKNVLANTRKVPKFDPETGDYLSDVDVVEPFTAAQVMYYRLKEVWFFDKIRGELCVRILEIEPFFEYVKDGVIDVEDGDMKAPMTKRSMGNIKYDELRPYLAQQIYYTPKNMTLKLSFDDILTWKRYFSSYIVAEGNIQNNREIQDYIKNPRDQRLESERILNQIRERENEVWEY